MTDARGDPLDAARIDVKAWVAKQIDEAKNFVETSRKAIFEVETERARMEHHLLYYQERLRVMEEALSRLEDCER